MLADQDVNSYNIVGTVSAPPRPDGVRVVVRDAGRCLDLVASPSSAYLLPDLADFSLVKREGRFAGEGEITIYGDTVRLNKLDGATGSWPRPTPISDWGLLVAPSTAVTSIHAKLATSATIDLARRSAIRYPQIGWAGLSPKVTRPLPPLPAPRLSQASGLLAVTLAPDAPVAAIASRISALTELGDESLAALFNVERETFCRWRTGVLTNPRPGNRRRFGLLLSVLDDVAGRDVNIRDWLLNYMTAEGLTPYDLLAQGRIDEVAYLASMLGEAPVARDEHVAVNREPEPLQFGDDDVWEPDQPDDER